MAQGKGQKKAAVAAKDAGEGRLVIPLNHGRHAYLVHGGRTVHVAVGSDAFVSRVNELVAAGRSDRLRLELQQLDERFPEEG